MNTSKSLVAFGHVWRYDPAYGKWRRTRKIIKPTIGINSCA